MPRFRILAPLLILLATSVFREHAMRLSAQSLEPGRVGFLDPGLQRARALLDSGFAWRATLLLDSVRAGVPGTPASDLLTAQAAAGWQGWSRVRRILSGASWLDLDFGGHGHALLARAALAERRDSAAVAPARRALRAADSTLRGERMVLLARALERIELHDSAASHYLAARDPLPDLTEWLALRAAGTLADSAQRAVLYRGITLPAARERIDWTEALARSRSSDFAGAARAYDRLGAATRAVEARLRLPEADRGSLRQQLFALLSPNGSVSEARSAIGILDLAFPTRTASEDLHIARRAGEVGLGERAAAGYGRAATAGLLTDADRFAYGTLLVRLGREERAIPQLAQVRDPVYRGRALYQRGRAILRAGAAGRAHQALQEVIRDFPRDVDAASSAIYLTADLETDAGRDSTARELFLRVGREYPDSRFADQARFRAALLAFVAGDFQNAAIEFTSLAERPGTSERGAALWWAGRARMVTGDTTGARTLWRTLAAPADGSFYVRLAAEQLGQPAWRLTDGPPVAASPAADRILERARTLEAVGLAAEAGFERAALERNAGASVAEILSTARSFAQAGFPAIGARLAQRAVARGAPRTRALALLQYPLPWRDVLEREARAAKVDPFLVSALIRQESAFDPQARSVADARGLMQVMPAVGRTLARERGIDEWDVVMLYQPEVSLAFGMGHLRDVLTLVPDPYQALAAYNAGRQRVERWVTKPGADDPLVFIERIPFVETRDYVRRVMQNLGIYRELYAPPSPTSSGGR